jgi:hypothetical protein
MPEITRSSARSPAAATPPMSGCPGHRPCPTRPTLIRLPSPALLNYLTALQMLTRSAHPADGATILVHCASGARCWSWARCAGCDVRHRQRRQGQLRRRIGRHRDRLPRRGRRPAGPRTSTPASTPSSTHSAGGAGRKTCRCCVPGDSWSSTESPKAQEGPAQPGGTPERHPGRSNDELPPLLRQKGVGITGLAGRRLRFGRA